MTPKRAFCLESKCAVPAPEVKNSSRTNEVMASVMSNKKLIMPSARTRANPEAVQEKEVLSLL
ncbi:MAG: hypothetical protein CNE95_07705 [Puniceicoccaceae bacterium MED-G30]|nr:MAG: hypothetical protein CNE95_07705 [Puniceicoccaceae bacterium MED-G30]